MSLQENYARAIGAKRIKWELTLSDVDYLIAAGLVREGLATRLLRLRAEFDTINRAELLANCSTTSHALALMKLQSLGDARELLGSYAQREATTRNVGLTPREVASIAGRVLDLFIDPTCPDCSGRGFTGGHGAPMLRCVVCKETGKRLAAWKTDKHEAFARWLQGSIDAKLERALAEMRRHLRQ